MPSSPSPSIADFFDIPEEVRPAALGLTTAAELATRIENAPLGILLADDRIRISYLNAIARPLFASLGNVIGRLWLDVLRMHWPAETADEVIDLVRRTLTTGTPHSSLDFNDVRIDAGLKEYYHWDIHRITTADGIGMVGCYFVGPLVRTAAV